MIMVHHPARRRFTVVMDGWRWSAGCGGLCKFPFNLIPVVKIIRNNGGDQSIAMMRVVTVYFVSGVFLESL